MKPLGAPPPPEEIAQLMQFVATKTKNVTSPMNVRELCRHFKEETGSLVNLETSVSRIEKYRQKIHEMNEFDMETKVKMIFALSAPVDAGFLIEIKKIADVEVNDQQRVIHYRQKNGKLELSAKSGQSSTTSASAKKGSGGIRTSGVATRSGNKKQKDSASTSSRNGPTTSTGRKRAKISDSEDLEDQNEQELAATTNSGVEDPNDFDYEPPQNHPEDEEVIVVNTIPVEQKPRVGVENPQDNNPVNEQDDVMIFQPAPVEQKPQGLLTISGPIREEKPTTSIKELLILLRGPVMAIKSPSLYGICAKFNTKIQELANGNQQMLVESVHIPLDSCLFLLLKNAKLKCPPEEEATSLRDFLLNLQANTCHIDHPSMESFHQKLQTKLFELSARDERIPINIIDRAIDHTLLMLDA